MADAPFTLETPVSGAALFSKCGRYRYWLTRRWTPPGPNPDDRDRCCFVMLNPSKADASKPDPTVTRCINFARHWGHQELAVVNLFAFRSTDPAKLRRADDPIGPENDGYLEVMARSSRRVVCAWGAGGGLFGRHKAVLWRLRQFCRPQCLRLTKGGQPEHPLYLPAHLEPFDLPEEVGHA